MLFILGKCCIFYTILLLIIHLACYNFWCLGYLFDIIIRMLLICIKNEPLFGGVLFNKPFHFFSLDFIIRNIQHHFL